MTLGDCIREYREQNRLSQRQFSEMCELSNAYISILEKNLNPKTKEPPIPSYGVYKKVATAMGISVQSLMEKADESQVSLGSNVTFEIPSVPLYNDLIESIFKTAKAARKTPEKELLELFATMTDSDKAKLLDYAQYIVDSYKRADKRRK